MKKYEFLLFDADNTILDFDENERVSITDTFRNFGLPYDEETVKKYHEINKSYWKLYDEKKVTKEELLIKRFVTMYEYLGVDTDPYKTEEYYREKLNGGFQVIKGAKELLSDLKKAGYKILITTNGVAATQHNRLDGSGISSLCDKIFISEEIGFHKPEKEYFEYVSNNTENFEKEKALVIGDSLTSDIAGGNDFGADTCWYNIYNEENRKNIIPTYEITDINDIRKILL